MPGPSVGGALLGQAAPERARLTWQRLAQKVALEVARTSARVALHLNGPGP